MQVAFVAVSREHGFQHAGFSEVGDQPATANQQIKDIRTLIKKSAQSVGLEVAVISFYPDRVASD